MRSSFRSLWIKSTRTASFVEPLLPRQPPGPPLPARVVALMTLVMRGQAPQPVSGQSCVLALLERHPTQATWPQQDKTPADCCVNFVEHSEHFCNLRHPGFTCIFRATLRKRRARWRPTSSFSKFVMSWVTVLRNAAFNFTITGSSSSSFGFSPFISEAFRFLAFAFFNWTATFGVGAVTGFVSTSVFSHLETSGSVATAPEALPFISHFRSVSRGRAA
mmetsp:Transcript_32899/g.70026  ORF Transcript_32899/g.70026 Transcript_32899/m.70026 type:complete len:219 (-) Transcript_32899:2934-3590(-)